LAGDPGDPLVARLEALTGRLREHALEADRLARLPEPVVAALRELRLFRLWIPRRYGGFELDLPAALRVYEAASGIDGSVGWAVMIGAGGGLFAAYLDPTVAAEIYADRAAVIAGSGAPDGRAERAAGGFRVTGRWRYASGADYATTFTANCVVTSDGRPVPAPDGAPLIRAMAFAPSQVRIVHTWNASGMRGTGSHDIEVADAFVPQQRSFSVFADAPREPGPLYRLPFGVLTELPVAAVAVGIVRHALDAFAVLAGRKKGVGSNVTLAEEGLVQARYAESHARWRLAQARLHALARQMWASAVDNRLLLPAERAEITAAGVSCVAESCAAVEGLAQLAGMASIDEHDEFARARRDLQTLAAHVAVSPQQLTAAGRVLLGA
jgi:alkylation response protein AidB-like acyl-CoA dehydrogenase